MRMLRRTTLIVVFCLAVLAGLGLSRKISVDFGLWPLLLASPCLLLLKPKNILSCMVAVLLGLGIGLWRGGVFMDHLHELQSLTGQKATITAKATSDSVYSTRSQIEFTANHARLLPGDRSLAGSFKISGFGEKMVYRGDEVKVTGKLFPMRGANQARIAYAQLERLAPDNSPVNDLTRQFDAGMQNALPEPQASFGLGLLIGQRVNLPAQVTAALTAVGLVHIIAVSGYNLTIMVRAANRLRLRSKYQKLILSLLLILGFILVTGFSASIVRAAAVSVLSLWAWYYGRNVRPLVLITATAAATGLWSPFYVWSDLGWWLSFLAFFGVLVIAPAISNRLFKKPPKMLTMVVIETLSAEVMTLPLIMMTFGQLSLIALVANAIIVPLVPWAMLLCAAAGGAGMLLPQLAGWLAWPARLLLTYMLDVVHIMANIPSVFLHLGLSPKMMIVCYGLVLLVVAAVYRHRKNMSTNCLNKRESPEFLAEPGASRA